MKIKHTHLKDKEQHKISNNTSNQKYALLIFWCMSFLTSSLTHTLSPYTPKHLAQN